ncbi:hypothetical protein [Sphingopyxis sp.]|uniref:hypothetical protein n=1 Tax=Sphingopyxis sp. TaxID=1908224 RepID=UPI003BAC8FC4
MKFGWMLMAGAALTPQLSAAQSCASYVGQTVSPRDIDDIMAPFAAIGPKSEFESTDQYNARKGAAIAKLGTALIVKKAPEDRKHLVYDADAQRLNIVSYAFRNLGFNSDALFGPGAPYRGVMDAGYLNIDAVVEEDEKVTGTYEASNSYGAKTVVSKVFRRTRGIFEAKAEYGNDALFPAAQGDSNIAGSIAMSPQDAMRLKPALQLAFVAAPKAPYFLSALYDYPSTPTIRNPREVKNEVSALIADIQCGLVLDPANIVLGAFETR